jgi:hypothetical protein
MNRVPAILLLSVAMLSATSCATTKGGKKHKRPSKGGGKGCDCPGFSHQHDEKDFHWDGQTNGLS